MGTIIEQIYLFVCTTFLLLRVLLHLHPHLRQLLIVRLVPCPPEVIAGPQLGLLCGGGRGGRGKGSERERGGKGRERERERWKGRERER